MARLKPQNALEAKHAAEAARTKSLRHVQAWEKTPAGIDALAAAAEFSALWRPKWQQLDADKNWIMINMPRNPVLIVTGGRTFCETHDIAGREVKSHDDAMVERRALGWVLDAIGPSRVVHGGAHGADRWAGIWAGRRGIEYVVVEARWKELGFQAGPERNARMVADYGATAGVEFPGAAGTADCASRMRAAGIPVFGVSLRTVGAVG